MKLSSCETIMPWQSVLKLSWTDWLIKVPFEVVTQVLILHKINFKKVEYMNGSLGVIIRALPATVEIIFTESSEMDSLRLDFLNPYQILSNIRTVITH